MSPDDLAVRIRGEYFEMPGLRLTVPQACRLWHIGRADCATVLELLVQQGVLTQTRDGAFVALPMLRRNGPAKAALSRTA